METLDAIRTRRSYGRLTEPAPTEEHLRQMLEAAVAAPDHGELKPWRFTLLRGPGLDAFGEVLEEAYELVEDGHLTEQHFREFTFSNVVQLYRGMNPSFFAGTVVEAEAETEFVRSQERGA